MPIDVKGQFRLWIEKRPQYRRALDQNAYDAMYVAYQGGFHSRDPELAQLRAEIEAKDKKTVALVYALNEVVRVSGARFVLPRDLAMIAEDALSAWSSEGEA